MKYLLIFFIVAIIPMTASAEKVIGESPICTSKRALEDFASAKMFGDVEKMEAILSNGSCVFVEPDVRAKILENNIPPKVIVFVPYKAPITGWTSQDNLE